VVFAFMAAAEIVRATPDVARVFLLFACALVIDATDGPLARWMEVKRWLPAIDGRTLDDIVDYLTYTFLPLLLVWRMGWVPEPGILWVVPALIASLFGFANEDAKDEDRGFFLGFPSYWNLVAFYIGIFHHHYGPWLNAAVLVSLTVLSILPVRFVYPNLAPAPWRAAITVGTVAWVGVLGLMLAGYPAVPQWLTWASLSLPLFYTWVSFYLWRSGRPEKIAFR